MDLIACGDWLQYSVWKRVALTIRYWVPWVLIACYKSKYIWLRYILWKLFKKRPVTWEGLAVGSPEEEYNYIAETSTFFYLYLSGKGGWLWYESRKQLEQEGDEIGYPVDWQGKGKGWYPFW